MPTLKRANSIFHFVLPASAPAAKPRPTPPSGHSQKQLWFGVIVLAESFLRSLTFDPNASTEMTSLLTALGGGRRSSGLPNEWIPELAAHLVSGQLLVIEMRSQKGSGAEGGKSEKKKKEEVALPVPRRGPVAERVEAPEASTFSNLNEDSQARALIVAAQSGAALCEVCNKA